MVTIARIILGLMFVVFGFNGFLHFLPMPPLPDQAQAFMGGLGQSGYFFPLLKVTEITCGFLILLNTWVPLALVILAPIVINIFCFHLFLAPSGLPVAIAIGGLELFLSWCYRSHLKPLLLKRP